MEYRQVDAFKQAGTAFSIIAFPIMLLFGFILHPNLLSFDIVTTAADWAEEWRGNSLFHLGHLLVLFAVPLIIVTSVRFMSLLKGPGAWYGFVGGMFGVFGAFMLAVDKGALTLGLTAFQTLSDEQFENALPALQTLLDKAGLLWILWLFLLLPLGFIIQVIGLLKEGIIPRWQAVVIIVGLLLLINPDIEIVSAVGASLMCLGFVPMGIRELKTNRAKT